MNRTLAIAILLCAAVPAPAGIYSPTEKSPFEFGPDGKPKPLWPTLFDQLHDDRTNTMNPAVAPALAKTREKILNQILILRPNFEVPTAFDTKGAQEYSAALIAVGNLDQAINLLVSKSRERQVDFSLMANLVQAYALSGDWDAALRSYESVLDAPQTDATPWMQWRYGIEKKYTPVWLRYHRDLARNKTDPATLKPIPLFGDGPLPPDAVAIVQQMASDAPTDVYLLWALAETMAKAGDFRAANVLFQRCTDRGFTQPKALMARRAEVQDIVAKLPKLEEKALVLPTIEPPSPPPPAEPKGLFDLISPEKFYILGGSFALIAVALLALQVRAVKRKRRRSR